MPALTWPVALAVLFGALLHASWNALIKRSDDKALDTAFIHVLGVVLALPVVLVVGLPRREAWPFLAGSLFIHIGYYIALVGAYRHGELGLTYPVMRGLAPLLVACSSAALLGESLEAQAWAGVVAISIGVIAMGLSISGVPIGGTAGNPHAHHGKALAYALANACLIALYTVVDGLGVRRSGDTAAYLATLFMLDGIPYFAIVMWQRRDAVRPALHHMAGRWTVALPAALASLGSYGIALWAMTKAPVAAVAALRETSVLFAAVIGALWLREAYGKRRIAATLLIVAGVITLRLA
ncbi:MAG: EamA family transporter [Burkholderiales bacterium]|nr:EamA family transporter [Burkholderiales bacterium]